MRYVFGAALVAALIATASAPADVATETIFFQKNPQQPVAGRYFTGLVITDTSGSTWDGFRATCGTTLAGSKTLRAQRSRVGVTGKVQNVVCSWHIPKDAKTLTVEQASAYAGQHTSYSGWLTWRVRH